MLIQISRASLGTDLGTNLGPQLDLAWPVHNTTADDALKTNHKHC